MRIVIDLQGAQIKHSTPELSLYIISLAQAIVRNSREHEVIIALSNLFPETIEEIRSIFDGLLLQENIRVWYAIGPVMECEPNNTWRREVAEHIREAFLAHLKPDIVYVTSLFAGFNDNAVTTINLFTLNICTIVACFDLPDMNKLQSNAPSNLHRIRKMHYLKQANFCHLNAPMHKDIDIKTEQLFIGQLQVNSPHSDDAFDVEAIHLIDIFEKTWKKYRIQNHVKIDRQHSQRLKLAFISPLPPDQSGISYYSVDLLQSLSMYYEIEVVVAQETVTDPWVMANCRVRSVDWFKENANKFARVLYHFGNSPFHQHMFNLLETVKGIVVLHDFYLPDTIVYRDALEYCETNGRCHDFLITNELFHSHGYKSISRYFHATNERTTDFPCNLSVLQNALGTIIHSETARNLAYQWHTKQVGDELVMIPLLKTPACRTDRTTARLAVNLCPDDFVICSFGMLEANKLNHQLITAWLNSKLARDHKCTLIFVGEHSNDDYRHHLTTIIKTNNLKCRIKITGWVDKATFNHYLRAADIAVQLRAHSRGETSAAVLDCMSHGLPVIVNAIGSAADLPDNTVGKLSSHFPESELTNALETLWQDSTLRANMGQRASELILLNHHPDQCAAQYAQTIEQFYRHAACNEEALIDSIATLDSHLPSNSECHILADSIAKSLPNNDRPKQLLIDISELCRADLKTGIQRVVRSLLLELINNEPQGYRVEPVYFSDQGGRWHLNYARKKTLEIMNCPSAWTVDAEVEIRPGDMFLGLDFSAGYVSEANTYLKNAHRHGLTILFVVYDILPILMSSKFPKSSSIGHNRWLTIISQFDGVLCISKSVADEFKQWWQNQKLHQARKFRIDWFHLGANIEASAPTRGIPENAAVILDSLKTRPSFLMVGTIEPRKGHAQTLSAFEALWSQGIDINLMILGKKGWMVDEVLNRLSHHPELNHRLFFIENMSDEYLEKIYATSSCLIAASEAEGFGLPLIEAAQHKLPIIARDIPVFREIAGEHALYFNGMELSDIAETVKDWLALYLIKKHPESTRIHWLTWNESAQQLKNLILQD